MNRPESREPTGWLLVGHGTRDAAGRAELMTTAELLAQRTAGPVEHSFLELAEPTIADGLTRLAARGVRRVVVVPLLLFSAGHAKQDVPAEVAANAERLGLVVIAQASPLDCHPSLLELSRCRFREAMGKSTSLDATILLMVGRGSSDPLAQAAMKRYCAALSAIVGFNVETAFVAAAEPLLPGMLEEIASRRPARVVVQPHLLFQGEVLSAIHSSVDRAVREHPAVQWLVAPHLGPHELLVEAILGRIREAESPGYE